jgi:hypothetical protein
MPPGKMRVAPERRSSRGTTIDEWKADPTVLSVTEEGLPPGWAKIIKRSQGGNKKVFFKSPTTACIKLVLLNGEGKMKRT